MVRQCYRPWANINPALVHGHWTDHALDRSWAIVRDAGPALENVYCALSVIVDMRHPNNKKHCPVLNGCSDGGPALILSVVLICSSHKPLAEKCDEHSLE